MKSNSVKWLRNPICTASSRQNNKFVEERQKKKKESSYTCNSGFLAILVWQTNVGGFLSVGSPYKFSIW